MENLTNFEAYIYIYLAITMGTLIYPIQLWFRVNFVNFIFMILLASGIQFLNIDISNIGFIFNDGYIKLFLTIVVLIVLGITYFRFSSNISLLDSIYLGVLPYSVIYFLFFSAMSNSVIVTDYVTPIIIYVFVYGIITYKKMIFVLPFAVKGMSDKE